MQPDPNASAQGNLGWRIVYCVFKYHDGLNSDGVCDTAEPPPTPAPPPARVQFEMMIFFVEVSLNSLMEVDAKYRTSRTARSASHGVYSYIGLKPLV